VKVADDIEKDACPGGIRCTPIVTSTRFPIEMKHVPTPTSVTITATANVVSKSATSIVT
jgi:hypothetical protein